MGDDADLERLLQQEEGDDDDDILDLLDELVEAGNRQRQDTRHERPTVAVDGGADAPSEGSESSSSDSSSGSSSSTSSSSDSDGGSPQAAGSGEADRPAAAAAAAAAVAALVAADAPPGHKLPAEIAMHFAGHSIVYYATTAQFVAQCKNPAHPKCFKTRTAKPPVAGRSGAQGRPLGHLAAWLEGSGRYQTKADHFKYQPPLAQRRQARARLTASPESAALLTKERPRKSDEDSEEPAGLP